ncbi:DUF4384 domain-containing protein [Elioraea tepidiphila]|uniref:DUF4384 domain-containing protein n=1 Tax=Elioraea tepidiphila TaxID=457934 RepID=UPI000476D9A7|nr:DUF4384 domain-containing protein [Elioraea tepidiphila]
MRGIRLVLVALASALVVAAGALAVLPSLMPEARLRALAGTLIGSAFHQPATVAGKVRLRLLPTPRLIAEALRVGAPGTPEGGLAASRLAGALDPLALLSGSFRFTELSVERAALSLTLTERGTLAGPLPRGLATAERMVLADGSVHLTDAATGRALTLTGLGAALRPAADGGPAELSVTLADPGLAASFAGRLGADGADGRLTLRTAALDGAARLRLNAGRLALEEARLSIGGSRVTATLVGAAGATRSQLSGRIAVDRLDLAAVFDRLTAEPWGGIARRLDAGLRLEAETVVLAGLTAGPTAVEIGLTDGRLSAALHELGLYGGRLVGRLSFAPGEDGPRLDTEFDLRDVAIGPMMAQAGLDGLSGTARGDLALVARGSTAADLLASLDGQGRLVVEDAALRDGAVAAGRLALTLTGRDQPLLIESGLRLNGRPVALVARAGPAGRLVAGGPLGTEAEVTLGPARLHLVADSTARPFTARGRLRFETRDLADFLGWLGVEAAATAELAAPARVDGQLAVADRALALDDARFAFGGGTASGRLEVDRSGPRPRLAASLRTETADLRRMLDIATSGSGQLLRALDGTLDLAAGQAAFGGLDFGRTTLAARLADGVLAAEARDLVLAGGRAGLTLRLDATDAAAFAATAALDLAEVDAATLFRGLTGQDLDALAGPISGPLALTLRGPSLRAATLDLAAELTLSGGRLSLPGFDPFPVETLRLRLDRLDAPAAVAGHGTWRDDRIAIDGKIGNPRAALAGGDAEIALSLQGRRFAARYDGTVTSPLTPPAAREPAAPAAPAPPPVAAMPAPVAAVPPRLVVLAPGGEVRVGLPLVLSVTAGRDGHLACFYQTGAGQVMRIFPNPARPDSAVTAGQELRIPDAAMGFEIAPATGGAAVRFACAQGAEPLVERLPPRLRAALEPLGETLGAVLAALPGAETETVSAEVAAVATRTIARPAPPRLATDRGDAPAQVGTPIVLRATVAEDGHLACFWRFGDGSLVRVLPNAHVPDAAVPAGRTVEIPGPGWPFQIVPETPGAEEQVVCLFAHRPVLPLLPDDLAGVDLAPLPDPDVDRLIARAAAIEGVSAARLAIRVAPR